MEKEANFPLISASWLAVNLKNKAKNLIVLDGTFHLPDSGRDALAEFNESHIPSARFFDINKIADSGAGLPHMLPSPEIFAQHVNALGIDNQSLIVVYDQYGLFSAARVWWMFRYFGHENIGILDGGLKAWRSLNLPLIAGSPDYPEPYGHFKPSVKPALVRNKQAVFNSLNDEAIKIVDMRGSTRFSGEVQEPRPGMRAGHMPSAQNIPYINFSDAERGYVKDFKALKTLLNAHGLTKAGTPIDQEVIATCGSGVSACTLAFVLYLLGKKDVAIYDGSWAEWSKDPDMPIVR